MLERFGLVDAADRRVSTYSGGMRRRLDLAAGLIGRPPVVLLDEPTTGLDPRSRQELWRIVDELRREGTTVLLTTQYLDEADRLAQRIAVVDRGRIAAQGTAGELKAAVGATILSVRLADPRRGARCRVRRSPASAPASSRTLTAPTARSACRRRSARVGGGGPRGWMPGGSRSHPSSCISRPSTTCS